MIDWRLPVFLAVALASSAFAQEREWTFDTGDEEAFLVFGVPESDDVGISFWCKIGSGDIRVVIVETNAAVAVDAETAFQFGVAGRSFPFTGRSQANEDAGVPSVEATVEASDAVFDALAAADRFTVTVAGQEDAYPLAGADFQSLRRVCARN